MKLNNQMILADIRGFKARIQTAKVKLAALPSDQPFSYKERKKREKQRRDLTGEIDHVNNLITIARSALKPLAVECDRATVI
jgi:hypothetical protein